MRTHVGDLFQQDRLQLVVKIRITITGFAEAPEDIAQVDSLEGVAQLKDAFGVVLPKRWVVLAELRRLLHARGEVFRVLRVFWAPIVPTCLKPPQKFGWGFKHVGTIALRKKCTAKTKLLGPIVRSGRVVLGWWRMGSARSTMLDLSCYWVLSGKVRI